MVGEVRRIVGCEWGYGMRVGFGMLGDARWWGAWKLFWAFLLDGRVVEAVKVVKVVVKGTDLCDAKEGCRETTVFSQGPRGFDACPSMDRVNN